jgi:hypothetical protein
MIARAIRDIDFNADLSPRSIPAAGAENDSGRKKLERGNVSRLTDRHDARQVRLRANGLRVGLPDSCCCASLPLDPGVTGCLGVSFLWIANPRGPCLGYALYSCPPADTT